jgi:hypothetical protein
MRLGIGALLALAMIVLAFSGCLAVDRDQSLQTETTDPVMAATKSEPAYCTQGMMDTVVLEWLGTSMQGEEDRVTVELPANTTSLRLQTRAPAMGVGSWEVTVLHETEVLLVAAGSGVWATAVQANIGNQDGGGARVDEPTSVDVVLVADALMDLPVHIRAHHCR